MRPTVLAIAAAALGAGVVHAEVVAPADVSFADDGADRDIADRHARRPCQGRLIMAERGQGNCIACHEVSRPERVPFHGEVGPVARRRRRPLERGRAARHRRKSPRTCSPTRSCRLSTRSRLHSSGPGASPERRLRRRDSSRCSDGPADRGRGGLSDDAAGGVTALPTRQEETRMEFTRRETLVLGAGRGRPRRPAVAAASAAADDAIAAFTGGAEVVEGGVTLTAPEIAENGNTVPIERLGRRRRGDPGAGRRQPEPRRGHVQVRPARRLARGLDPDPARRHAGRHRHRQDGRRHRSPAPRRK